MSRNSAAIVGNPMRERFAREFLKDGNGSGAARRAGYSARGAASQLLGLEDVQARIRALHRSQMRRLQLEGDEVLMAWTRIANFDPASILAADGSVLPLQSWPKEARLCVHSIDIQVVGKPQKIVHADGREEMTPPAQVVKVRFNDRMDALVNLGRHHNLFAKEAREVGQGMSQGFTELVERAQSAGGGVQGLLTGANYQDQAAALPAPAQGPAQR